jgi:penicillin-binding protein 1C
MQKNLLALLFIVFLTWGFYLFIPLPDPLFENDYSMVVYDRDDHILRVFLNQKEQWCFPPEEENNIPEKLKIAVLNYEDRFFFSHRGVNPFAVFRAIYQNTSTGKRISGASTITMQLARLMQPKLRTLSNKLMETFQATKIELTHSKKQILCQYLSHAPYGGNIIGYQAASIKYFNKTAFDLTWSEAAILAVLPNSPGLISPHINQVELIQKKNRILKTLFDRGLIDRETFQLAVSEPLQNKETTFPMIAPHFCQSIKNHSPYQGQSFHSTIDLNLQKTVQRIIHQQIEFLQNFGISNASALVAETRSGKIRAYIGSQDFFDNVSQGQVDGVIAPRSSGSILKPFLYALSIDEGIILPSTLIKDIPSFFGKFSPSNANKKFSGVVSARDALIQSLNVPAVRLLFSYGYYSFYLFLKNAGLTTLFRMPDDYGLPLILGGAEVNLWDLVKLYRGLANYGTFSDLQIQERDTPEKYNIKNQTLKNSSEYGVNKNLISPGACWLTLDILNQLKRPGAEYYWEQYQQQWPIAWKTGTSYGQRDAWAVGVSPQWTIGVWVGNFSGEANPELSGAKCSGPILFDIFNSLPKDAHKSWFTKPTKNLKMIKVCLQSGFLAGENCPDPALVPAPNKMKSLKLCPYHKGIYVDSDKQFQVCSLCWQPGNYSKQVYFTYPAEVAQYLRERGQLTTILPSHNKTCPSLTMEESIKIIYPINDSRLWIPRDINGHFQTVILRAAHQKEDQTIFWYLDNLYLGETDHRHIQTIDLTQGWHTLEVLDSEGNRDFTHFYVNRNNMNRKN